MNHGAKPCALHTMEKMVKIEGSLRYALLVLLPRALTPDAVHARSAVKHACCNMVQLTGAEAYMLAGYWLATPIYRRTNRATEHNNFFKRLH